MSTGTGSDIGLGPDSYRAHLRLTDALRRVIEANAYARLSAVDEVGELIEMADALADRLEAHAGDGRYHVADGPAAILDDPGRAMAVNPVIGRCSPIAPPVDMTLRGGEVRGTARLGRAYEGPPGRVHGGWVCALLDQVLGFACVADGNPSFTATITVHLRKATPLDTELELSGRVTEVSGRRVTAWGAIRAGGELTAEAEGLFILIPADFAPPGRGGSDDG